MKRWLLILLVLLMPLQAGWAAVGAYCLDGPDAHALLQPVADEHDAGDAAHAETHAEAHVDAGSAQACDLGCSHCHGHGLSLPLSLPVLGLPSLSADAAAEPVLPGLLTLAPRPERPQWTHLA